MGKKEPLIVGQKVWMEIRNMYFQANSQDRAVHEFEIIEANKSSAYAVSAQKSALYKESPKSYVNMKNRIDQRTHRVQSAGFGATYVLWLTEEEFLQDMEHTVAISNAREIACDAVNDMTLAELNLLSKNIHDIKRLRKKDETKGFTLICNRCNSDDCTVTATDNGEFIEVLALCEECGQNE